jgi:hypothetical protein
LWSKKPDPPQKKPLDGQTKFEETAFEINSNQISQHALAAGLRELIRRRRRPPPAAAAAAAAAGRRRPTRLFQF